MKVTTVIIPAAGKGLRMLPLTKTTPKELLPVGAKPVIQHAVEEAAEAGLERIVLVVSPNKESLGNYLARDIPLEDSLIREGKDQLATVLREVCPSSITIEEVVQHQPLGLGDAIHCATSLVQDKVFAVILPDDLMFTPPGEPSLLGKMIDAVEKPGDLVLALQDIPASKFSSYGVCECRDYNDKYEVQKIVEKPEPAQGQERGWGVVGRYVLDQGIMRALEGLAPGTRGEVQLTDAIALAAEGSSHRILGVDTAMHRRFDCGSMEGYAYANISYWLRDYPDMRELLQQEGEQTASNQSSD